MRRVLADVRFGLSSVWASPGTGGRSAAWLLAGLLLGAGASCWPDAPPRPVPEAAVIAPPGPLRVRIDAVFAGEPEAIGRLRCMAGRARCPTSPPTPPPCPVPPPASLQS